MAVRLTYALLKEVHSLSKLKKMGFTVEQITKKLGQLYLREQNAQLYINDRTGQTLSLALRRLGQGNFSQKIKIPVTVRDLLKDNLNNLKKLAAFEKKQGIKQPFAQTLLNQFYKAESNFWELSRAIYSYSSAPAQYESKESASKLAYIFNNFQEQANEVDKIIKDRWKK